MATTKPAASASRTNKAAKKTVLFIGWSSAVYEHLPKPFKGEEWNCLRLDPDPALNADLIGGLGKISELASGSIDAVWCPHVLQKVFPHEAEDGLRECFRALREGGGLSLQVPDGQLAATYLANNQHEKAIYTSSAGPVRAIDMLYGFRPALKAGRHFLAHRQAFTAEMLGLTVRDAGFTNIHVQIDRAEIALTAYKYSYEHPKRVERITMTAAKQSKAPQPPKMPAGEAGAAPASPALKSGGMTDRLDQPPAYWQPLKLKGKA